MLYAILAVMTAVLFVLGVRRDRRRVANAVWLGLTLVFSLLWLVSRDDLPEWLDHVIGYAFVIALLGSGLVLPVVLIINGVVMLRREGRALGNLLSLLTGLAIITLAGVFIFAVADDRTWVHAVVGSLVITAAYVAFLFVSLLLYSIIYGKTGRRTGFDAVIVLGAGLMGDRVPPLLAGRLDRATRVYHREVTAGHAPVIVVSGGRGADEETSEAVAMRGYLLDRGVPDDVIVLEDRATTTEENLRYSKALLEERGHTGRTVAVTNNYHVFRTAVLARRLRMRTEVIGSRTAWYFWPSAFLREFVAILARRPIPHVLVCGLLVGLYLFLVLA
ncbi:ElyC/SanA/YdcF family protein [Actinosynnema sp. NPDC023587]|uniref:YdcF family protein n=1 Tax=Actinosynnema sp. NPDC023587 TaxID=3154695 RepID=UPI0033C6A3E5